MSERVARFTPREERAALDILIELYAQGRFVTYQALANAIGFTGGQQSFVRAIIASARICHDHSSRIVTRDARGGTLASARIATETQSTFAPAAHLRDDEAHIARTGRVPAGRMVVDVDTLRSFIRPEARGGPQRPDLEN